MEEEAEKFTSWKLSGKLVTASKPATRKGSRQIESLSFELKRAQAAPLVAGPQTCPSRDSASIGNNFFIIHRCVGQRVHRHRLLDAESRCLSVQCTAFAFFCRSRRRPMTRHSHDSASASAAAAASKEIGDEVRASSPRSSRVFFSQVRAAAARARPCGGGRRSTRRARRATSSSSS